MTSNIRDTKDLVNLVVPLRLACLTNSGWPIIVPLWFKFLNDRFYCATQENAKIISYLNNDNRCAFEISSEIPPYRGIRGQGKALIKKELAIEILQTVIEKYIHKKDTDLTTFLFKRKEKEVAIEITPIKIFYWDYTNRMKIS
ncbi:MAG TPA: pyridoxamine 5'-phosphate oxidase family protein [Nitrososphaeraceae archaeon]|nr:pyridoxamine 5'-phosphate oxidase family protein [Nitrososphaeraceae archaeon]